MKDSQKERVKLRASNFDRASTVCLTIGVVSPLANHPVVSWSYALATISWLAAAGLLHYIAFRTLGGLDR